MPTYGYRCTNCGHQFEIQQRMSDEPLKVCPECNGKLTKVLYPAGIVFKGSGFYKTDYKAADASLASANGSSATPNAKSEGKAEGKPESKVESKPESKSDSGD